MGEATKVAAFDVDMTLTTEEAGDFHLKCFGNALKKVLDIDIDMKTEIDYPGKTDFGVMLEAAKMHNKVDEFYKRKGEIKEALRYYFEKGIGSVPIKLMPGAKESLDYLSTKNDAVLTLMTGNSAGIAKLKMERLGIADYFVLEIGGYGDGFENRSDIVRDLVKKSESYVKREFGNSAEVYIFDDSPRGAKAAVEGGAKCIALMTGYTKKTSDFSPYKPVSVLNDLTEIERIKEIFR